MERCPFFGICNKSRSTGVSKVLEQLGITEVEAMGELHKGQVIKYHPVGDLFTNTTQKFQISETSKSSLTVQLCNGELTGRFLKLKNGEDIELIQSSRESLDQISKGGFELCPHYKSYLSGS